MPSGRQAGEGPGRLGILAFLLEKAAAECVDPFDHPGRKHGIRRRLKRHRGHCHANSMKMPTREEAARAHKKPVAIARERDDAK
jgi:hypothetical protein